MFYSSMNILAKVTVTLYEHEEFIGKNQVSIDILNIIENNTVIGCIGY